MLFNSVV